MEYFETLRGGISELRNEISELPEHDVNGVADMLADDLAVLEGKTLQHSFEDAVRHIGTIADSVFVSSDKGLSGLRARLLSVVNYLSDGKELNEVGEAAELEAMAAYYDSLNSQFPWRGTLKTLRMNAYSVLVGGYHETMQRICSAMLYGSEDMGFLEGLRELKRLYTELPRDYTEERREIRKILYMLYRDDRMTREALLALRQLVDHAVERAESQMMILKKNATDLYLSADRAKPFPVLTEACQFLEAAAKYKPYDEAEED